ncbi:MAG: hypothetical protein KBA53_08390 [Thermoclostridium sp.]|nr:hypothetical protein [Thermoclostridium sp.]
MNKNDLTDRSCTNCIRGVAIGIRNEILCREKGVVSPSYSCNRFMAFDKDWLKRPISNRCSDCLHFTFTPDAHNSSYGVCSMFSVRKCDGSQKKACSKFTKRTSRTA